MEFKAGKLTKKDLRAIAKERLERARDARNEMIEKDSRTIASEQSEREKEALYAREQRAIDNAHATGNFIVQKTFSFT